MITVLQNCSNSSRQNGCHYPYPEFRTYIAPSCGSGGVRSKQEHPKRLKHPSQPPNFPPTNQILQHRSTLPVDGIHHKRYPIKCIKLTEKGYPSCSGKYRRRLGCYVEVPRQTYANDPIGDQARSLLSGTRRRHALTSLRPLSYAELCAEPGPKTA